MKLQVVFFFLCCHLTLKRNSSQNMFDSVQQLEEIEINTSYQGCSSIKCSQRRGTGHTHNRDKRPSSPTMDIYHLAGVGRESCMPTLPGQQDPRGHRELPPTFPPSQSCEYVNKIEQWASYHMPATWPSTCLCPDLEESFCTFLSKSWEESKLKQQSINFSCLGVFFCCSFFYFLRIVSSQWDFSH